MAPRRNNALLDGSVLTDMQNLQLDMLLMESQQQAAPHELVTTCCVPSGDCLRGNELIYLNNNNNNCAGGGANFLEDVVRVQCSNEACAAGRFMHRECFEHWEEGVLAFVRSSGRARSWSEKQRHQNLWTKKGYDLAFRACGCACGRGFLKKDVDWCAAAAAAVAAAEAANGAACDAAADKKRRKRRQNARPTLAMSAFCGANGYAAAVAPAARHAAANGGRPAENVLTPVELRARTISVSSSSNASNGSSSPPASSSQCSSNSPTTVPLPGVIGSGQKKKKKTKKPDPFSALNGSGIFFRRKDFSAFNILPRHKLNSYHVKMEDEGNHGNDEIRSFVLSNLTAHHQSRVLCVLCSTPMKVYDRYPLIDGTFFLSPVKHAKGSVEVSKENRRLYLSGICMRCLEAFAPGTRIRCVYCSTPFDGGSMVLGTMYLYDVFAAQPCCQDRVRCTGCQTPILLPHERLGFYSDYSRQIICPHCHTKDFHFVRPISACYALESPT